MMRWTYLGLMDYDACYQLQKQVHQKIVESEFEDLLILVQHPPVLTLGANFHEENLLLKKEKYEKMGIQVLPTDRGGDVTYHGPGQLVMYPIFNLNHYGKDLHQWLRLLEELVIETLQLFGLKSRRFPPHTGVWVEDKKIAAIGIKVRKWVSLHGIALNCNNDLSPFGLVVPCGIHDYGVTSLTKELGYEICLEDVIPNVLKATESVFHCSVTPLETSLL